MSDYITRQELEAAMQPNGKIENVAVLVVDNFNPRNYFRMCAFSHCHCAGVRSIALFADDSVWLFLPNGHPNAKVCSSHEVWKCDIVYRSNRWEGDDARIYAVDVFTVHPKERLEKWS